MSNARFYEAEGEQSKKLAKKHERKLTAFIVWFWMKKYCMTSTCECGRCVKIGRRFSCAEPIFENLRKYRNEVLAANPQFIREHFDPKTMKTFRTSEIVAVTADRLGSEVGQRHE